jgi:hypothetical protein
MTTGADHLKLRLIAEAEWPHDGIRLLGSNYQPGIALSPLLPADKPLSTAGRSHYRTPALQQQRLYLIAARGSANVSANFGVIRACTGFMLRTKGIKPQFPNGIVSSVSFVSTTNTARSLAGFVLLALALTPWRSPGSSEKLCPAL